MQLFLKRPAAGRPILWPSVLFLLSAIWEFMSRFLWPELRVSGTLPFPEAAKSFPQLWGLGAKSVDQPSACHRPGGRVSTLPKTVPVLWAGGEGRGKAGGEAGRAPKSLSGIH